MAHGLTLALIGLAAGVAAALMLTRLMKALLFEVSPNDPATLAGVAALITVVAAAASLVPAVRATRVDPIVALRDESRLLTAREGAPAGRVYLEGIFAIINASASGRPSLFHIAHLSLRHPSQRVSPAPAWVDRILFRIIVAIGTLVGAYPASDWPGAPTIGRGDGKPRATLA
jgi:hypothetical protein